MSRLVVSISHVEFTEMDQTFYVVKVTQDADEWQVRRTYSDFRHLRDDVARVLRDDKHQLVGDDSSRLFARSFHELAFPGKKFFGSKKDHVVKDRAIALHHFLIKLLFLTHSYRKAQKQLYDDTQTAGTADTTSLVVRPQGSATVFYLLRDFLKPTRHANNANANNTNANGNANANNIDGSVRSRTSTSTDDEHDDHTRRLLRESKMLAMRASQNHQHQLANSQSPLATKAKSAPQLAQTRSRNASTPRRAAPPPPPPLPMAPEVVAAAVRHGASPPTMGMEMLMLDPTDRRSVHFHGQEAEEDEVEVEAIPKKTLSIAALGGYATTKPRAASSSSTTTTPSAPAKRFNDRISSNDHQPVLRAIGSDLHIVESIPDPQPRSLSSSSTSSSSASLHARSLETATALALGAPTGTGSISSLTSSFNDGSSAARRRPRSKKKNLSHSMSSLSRAEKQVRNSERLSRLTPQLTAQTITLDAQKELEKHVSEYNAIMIMRYVDRFISKAVGKTPGCYTVMDKRLEIDSGRFVHELEEVLHDLPSNFQDAFRAPSGDYCIPPALDAYVQLKWDSFQGCSIASGGNEDREKKSSKSSKAKGSKASDSDDSDDTDSDYQPTSGGGGGYMKRKTRAFTEEESDELQMMIAEGTAGKEQMQRLRRQHDEKGWQRRTMPSATVDNDSDTDEDEHDRGSGTESSIKRFQQMQNAMRKSRMSRHDDIGGLV